MATRRGIAPRHAAVRAGDDAACEQTREVTSGDKAWLLVVPALAGSLLLIVLLGPPLGRFAFTGTDYTFWPSAAGELFPKPTELARFFLTVACSLAFAAALPLAARLPLRLPVGITRIAVLMTQALLLALLAFLWWKQRDVNAYDIGDQTYFAPSTLIVAGLLTALAALGLSRPSIAMRLRALPTNTRWSYACSSIAVLVTVLWLLPSIYTDANVALAPHLVTTHLQFSYDESMSVLDGRSPLVNMATYGALVPYLIALPLAAFSASLAAFTTLMVILTAVALLGIHAVLRRLTHSPVAALVLYVPFLATSLFIVTGEAVERFDFGNYFGMFPIRYAGPYLLLWLVVRHLDGDRPRSFVPLFAFAGLVALNNTDFGLPALGATLAALLCARPPRGRVAVAALIGRLAAGLAIAYALVATLTLLREGTLPHLDRLVAFARLFGVAGFGNLPTPLLGFHLVILATFVGAAATAAVRLGSDRHPDATLTGVLAWCGVFGLGTGSYFAYRSHPYSLIALFSIWSLTLIALLIAAMRSRLARAPGALPSLPLLALLFGFSVTACSITQFPLPWPQVDRIASSSQLRSQWSAGAQFVRAYTRAGDTVAIPTALGHHIAYLAGVINITGYTGLAQMPTVEQLRETIRALRASGGRMLFFDEIFPELPQALADLRFRPIARDPSSSYTVWRYEPPRR